jgi:hypothetical protein
VTAPANCPWCCERTAPTDFLPGKWFVHCSNLLCDANGPVRDTEAEAVAAWNEVAGIVAAARAEAPKNIAAPETFAAIVRLAAAGRDNLP